MELFLQIIKDTGRGIKGYITSQIILMAISFMILSFSLSMIQVPRPILISFGISTLDILPVIGSGIIMVPWSIVNLIWGNNQMGRNLGIIYIILVIIRQIIEPRILGKRIGIRPIYTFISTVLGSIILGPIGVIIGPLIAVIINSIIKSQRQG